MTNALVVGLGLVVTVLAVLVVGLLRSHAEILKALHDLGVNLEDGAPPATRASGARSIASSGHAPMRTAPGVARPRGEDAPFTVGHDITGDIPSGGVGRAAVVAVDHSTLLAFLSTGCGTCGVFWDALGQASAEGLPGQATRVVVVTNGPDAESPAAVAELAPAGLVTLMSGEAWDAYGVPVSPYFVLVDGPSGRVVGEGSGTSWDQILDLLTRAEADGAFAASARPAPDRTRMGGQDRADWVDAELRAAGVLPGDPSLYPAPHASHGLDGEPR